MHRWRARCPHRRYPERREEEVLGKRERKEITCGSHMSARVSQRDIGGIEGKYVSLHVGPMSSGAYLIWHILNYT